MFLVCNQCGNHNPDGAVVCALCNDPLSDEKEQRRKRGLWLQIPSAIVVTASLYLVPAIPIQIFLGAHDLLLVGGAFWMFYTGLWAAGFFVSNLYTPKEIEKLDTGDRGGMTSLNPLTAARQNLDRDHVAIGLLLFPVNLVKACWAPIFANLRRRKRRRP